jgi:hypothetical protein
MPISFAGGCACCAIRYECNGEPLTMFHCHCRDCQRATGAPYSSVIGMPGAAFNLLQGMPRWYSTPRTAGGLLDRGFCSDCGSPLFGRGEIVAELRQFGIHVIPWLYVARPEMHLRFKQAQIIQSLLEGPRRYIKIKRKEFTTEVKGFTETRNFAFCSVCSAVEITSSRGVETPRASQRPRRR